ncbi:MAG TPA: hypothetical protein VGP92_10385 [Acidimicrobiia bacterium]|nr:hypothetical protein [Acidimicrobiia bacterium]
MLLRSWINPLCIALCVIAAVFVVIGLVYFFVPPTHLPSFLPGHIHGAKRYKVHHVSHPGRKRALLAMIPAALPLAGAWWLRFRYSPLD